MLPASFYSPSAPPRAPRNGLGTVTFVVVVLAALLAVFPRTAPFGFLLCLAALVPAGVAYVRIQNGTATNRVRSVAALAMAPVFLVVAVIVGAAATPAPRVATTGDTSALLATSTPEVAPLPAAPPPTSTTAAPTSTGRTRSGAATRPPSVAARTSTTAAPATGSAAPDATAQCTDETHSSGRARSDPCAHHGGAHR